MQVCDLNVRASQRFLVCSGFVSVFSSALVTRCVLTVFAQVGVKAGFCTVPRGPDEVIDLKKEKRKGCVSATTPVSCSLRTMSQQPRGLCCPFQDKHKHVALLCPLLPRCAQKKSQSNTNDFIGN